MKPRSDIRNSRSKGADQESSHSLVGDLLRRVKSPEVLAGVAGAAAAAHFTKHAVEHSEDDAPQEQADIEAEDEAEVETEDEAEYKPDAENEAEDETEDEPDVENEAEDEADVEEETEDEPEDEDEPDVENDAEDETEDEADIEEETEHEPEDEDETDVENEAEDETEDEPDVATENRAEAMDDEANGEEEDSVSGQASATNGSLKDDDRMQLLGRAREYAEQLTGHSVESFSGLAEEDRGWRVGMEVVEVSRIPATTDVLASYEVILTGDGELVDFRRAGRYYRNATDGTSS
jgi:hypothetical protein